MKMRVVSLLVLVSCLCFIRAEYYGPTFSSPLFMWSNTRQFSGKNMYVNEYTSVDQLSEKFLSKITSAEAIFVFLEPELRSEQFPMLAEAYEIHPNGGAFSKLKGTLESYSSSSIVIPYAHVNANRSIGLSVVTELAKQLGQEASVILAVDSDNVKVEHHRLTRLSLSQLKDVVTKDWSILSNGVMDLVIIGFDSPAVHPGNVNQVAPTYARDDTYMYQLLLQVEANYVAIFTADMPATESVKLARANMMVRQLTTESSIYPAEVVEAHIVMIPFLIILFTGICCTFGVQSDLKFDAERKTFKK